MTVSQNKLFGAYFFATSEKTKMPKKTWTGADGEAEKAEKAAKGAKGAKASKASYKAQLKSGCQRSG